MGIEQEESLIHWNYYLALEEDLENLSRYIEFNVYNQHVYSVELAHLLLAACSEVDVIAKEICKFVAPRKRRNNIEHYREIITKHLPKFAKEAVSIPRYTWKLDPWELWRKDRTPIWWINHNQVKHQRNDHFKEASLKNTVNALGALLVCEFYYHRLKFPDSGPVSLIEKLTPWSSFLRLRITESETGLNMWLNNRLVTA